MIAPGGGTGGCTAAYFLAKWMEDNNIPGTVLVVDRGSLHSPEDGPDPNMKSWFKMWGNYTIAHDTTNRDGSHYPVPATEHRGFGGAGTHDTRITFQLRPEQQKRMSQLMGWSHQDLQVYYQAALNLMPLYRAITKPEPFFEKCIDVLTHSSSSMNFVGEQMPPLSRLPRDEWMSDIVIDAIAEVSMAMVGTKELRWSSAYLLHPQIRPRNLEVIACADVDKVTIKRNDEGAWVATGVILVDPSGNRKVAQLSTGGSVAITSGAMGTPAILQRSGIGPGGTLEALGIDCIVDNPEVGHGVDHQEIGVAYEWLSRWNTPDGKGSKGGATGWPLVLFTATDSPSLQASDQAKGEMISPQRQKNYFTQAHFGAGSAEPYTDQPCVVITPSCVRPDPTTGYRVLLASTDPAHALKVIHEDQSQDYEAMARGIQRVGGMFEALQQAGLCGARVEPPPEISLDNKPALMQWIKESHGTVFHWASTCKAGVTGDVADERFRVRSVPLAVAKDTARYNLGSSATIGNLFLGSAAALPEIPEGNPHLSVTAFSVALAHEMLKDKFALLKRLSEMCDLPVELQIAKKDLLQTGKPVIRRPGEERPRVTDIIIQHHDEWKKHHPEEE